MQFRVNSFSLLAPLLLSLACSSAQKAHGDTAVTPSQQLGQALSHLGAEVITSPNYKPGLVRHIVLFRYKAEVTLAQKEIIKRRFLALKNLCLRNGVPYVLSIETGAQSSGEGVDQGLEEGFVVTFKSEGDRNFYVGQPVITDSRFYDPAHQAFKDFVGPLLHEPINPTGVLVFDYAVEGRNK